MHDFPKRFPAHAWQPIWPLAECPLERPAGPSRRAILFAIGLALQLGHNAGPFGQAIHAPRAAALLWLNGCQPRLVEAHYQLPNCIAAAPTFGSGCCAVVRPGCHA
jgi:hypothetical protein